MTALFLIALGIIFGAAAFGAAYYVLAYLRKQNVLSSFRYRLFLVTLPKPSLQEAEKGKLNLAEVIGPFESFLLNVAKPNAKIIFEIAQPHIGEEIFFYVAVERRDSEAVEKVIKSFFPGAEVTLAQEDYNIFNPNGAAAGAAIALTRSFYYPIKTYSQLGFGQTDPLDGVLGSFAKLLNVGEGMSYQLVVERLGSDYTKKIFKAVMDLKKGKEKREVLERTVLHDIRDFTAAGQPKKKEDQPREPKVIDEGLIKALEFKGSKPLYRASVRVIASAGSQERADDILDSFEHTFSQFINEPYNGFKTARARGSQLRDLVFLFAFRMAGEPSCILNAEELSSILHFPNSLTKTANVHWLHSRSAPPPVNIPAEGIVLGKSMWGAGEKLIRIADNDRRRHVYVIGQTGTGKSVLMKEMIRQDILAGKGVGFIDPHGDAAETILTFVPPERMQDVIYFDPGHLARPFGFNPLEYDARFPEQKTLVINELIEAIDKLYNLHETGGPIFEQYFRNGMLLVMDNPERRATLIEFVRLFADEEYRFELIDACKNPLVVQFWTKEAPQAQRDFALSEVVTYITSKLTPFLSNDFIRPIIGQPNTALNFRDIIDSKKIFIVNLSKGKVGDINSYLLGMIIVSRLMISAFSRINIPNEEERQDFFLYIDEFQNVTTKTIATIFAEARKYRLNLTVANQYIKQLTEDIRSAILGNVGTLVSFRVGPEDTEMLEKPFAPVFTGTDLVNLPNFKTYVRLLINNQTTQPFDMMTLPPSQGDAALAAQIKERSYETYGKPLKDVEEDIARRYVR